MHIRTNRSANQCFLKVAHFAADTKQYKKAADLFVKLGNASVDNNQLKWSTPVYFLEGSLCLLLALAAARVSDYVPNKIKLNCN